MLRIRVSDNTNRKTVIVNATETLNEAIAKSGISPQGNAQINLNGGTVTAYELNNTFEEFGYEADKDYDLFISLTQAKNNA